MSIQKSKVQEAARKHKYAMQLLKNAVVALEDAHDFFFSCGAFGGDGGSLLTSQFDPVDDAEGFIAETGVSRNSLLLGVGVAESVKALLDNSAVSAADRRTIMLQIAG